MERSSFQTLAELASYAEELERRYAEAVFQVLYRNAGNIHAWYNEATKVVGTWAGKTKVSPKDKSVSWDQVGETVTIGLLAREFNDWFPIGLPIGSEVRFGTNDAVVHVDVKTHKEGDSDLDDNQDVRPEQISADESDSFVVGADGAQLGDCPPRLPPYYEFGPDLLKVTVSLFVICVYEYDPDSKLQYLTRLQLFTVPNGVVREAASSMWNDVFRAGKDGAKGHRYRVVLPKLEAHDPWRWREIRYRDYGFEVTR